MVREYSKALISSYMKIYDAKKIEIADVPVTKNAKHEQELMKSDYIRLEWSQEEYMPLPVGAYIEHEGVKYSLFGQYVPDNNGGVYQYKPEFQHPMMLLAHTPCLLTTRDSVGKEIKQTDWTYTGILSTILGRLQGIIYDQLGIMLTFETKFKPTTDVEESATCTFSGVDIISAFSEVCNQFGGIEYHIDWEGKTVWFGDIFLGDEVSLEEGGNVGMASKSMNSKDYANYFIVRGGTRNITNKTALGDNVQSDSRLSIDDIDKRASTEQPRVQKILTFDYIYPQLDLYVYNVRKRVRRLKDEDKQYIVKRYNADGTVAEYKTYAVYYMRLAYKDGEAWKDYIINNPSDDIVAGKKLTASFEPNEKGTHSQLAGREYELIYHKSDKTIIANPTTGDSGVNILAGDYEIVFEQDGDLIIPNIDTLQPWGNSTPDDTCDKVVLYNIVMSDEYITNAKVRLAEEAEKEIMRQYTDKTNYTVHSNPIEFAKRNPGLSIGRAVRYRTLSGEVMSTRINRLSTQLDYPIEQEITLGNAVIKGNTQQLREDVKSISVAIDVNESSATRINSMLNSMMRELMEYDAHLLHRDRDDETAYKLTVGELLVKGIAKILSNVSVGGKVSTNGINNDGDNVTKGLTELYDVIRSNGFKGSMTAGSGWQIDKNGNAQVESIEVRSYMRVLELVMNRLSAEESEFVFTESGTVETATLNEDGSYTLVMRKKTDKDITAFQEGDVLKGVVNNLAEQGAVGVKYYTSWVLVEKVYQETNSIQVSVYKDKDTPAKKNFPPCDLMVLHRWGNADETKKERQSCWYISSIEKRIVMLDGVTKPIIGEKNYASFYGLRFDMKNFMGYSLNANQPYLYVRGALLQDVCFIDYKGQIVKQERYRGVWSKEVAESNDPYIVKETTFDTVYHKNAKWQCTSTTATTVEPSTSTTDWIRLTEETTGSDGKSAAKAYVTSNDIAIPTDADGIVSEDFSIGNTFTLMVDGKKCTDLKVTMDGTPATDAFKAELNKLWLTISSSKDANFGSRAYTLHFTVTGTLNGDTYTDIVTILVRPNKKGKDGKNLTKVSNFYKWGASGTEAPSGEYTKDAIPKHVEGLDYLWNYEKCYNDAGETISTSEKTCIGNFARGIESITEYYQIGTEEKPTNPIKLDSNNTPNTSGWQTTMPSLTAEKRYLWNQEVVKFTDGTYSVSEVHLAGAQGESITIEQKLVYYAISASGTRTPPDDWFGDTVKEPTEEKPYLWTCVSVRYSDTTVVKYYTVARRGQKGDPGKDGRNLTKVVNYYKWGDSGTVVPIGEYTKDAIPQHTDGLDYLWNYEECYSHVDKTDVLISQSGKTCIGYFPKDGIPGKEGKGIVSITEYYQIGTEKKPTKGITVNSDNVLDTTGWKPTMDPTTNENRFVWNQEVIQFTDGKYSISAIHLAGAQGADGIDGADAKSLSLRCDRQVINCDDVSNPWDDSNITIEAVLENLSGTVTWTIDWDNANGEEIEDTRYEIRGNVLEITDTYYFTDMCYNIYITAKLGQYSAKTTIVVVNDGASGKNGKDGKPLVGPTEWSKDVRYLSGKSNEAYQSIVINPKYPKQMFLCGYTHSGVEPAEGTYVTSVNSCTPEKPWVGVTYQDFVATKVLFAERGKIENLDITNATIQGTITDMAVKTKAEWDAVTNALVPKADKDRTEVDRNFQIVDPSKAGSYFIPTIDPTSSDDSETIYDRGPQIVFLPTYSPTAYDIITCKTEQTGIYKTYNIPKYQIAGTHIRITKGGAPRQYLRWAYLEDAGYDRLWTSGNTINRQTIRDIYNLGTLICADNKIFRVYNGIDKQTHNIQGAWYYGDSDYKHGRFSVNGTVARMLWLMPGQTVELVSQIEEINRTKCLVWSVVNSSDFTAVNVNADFTKRYKSDQPAGLIQFHGESDILDPALADNVDKWEDCFMAHRKIDNLLLGGKTNEVPSLFINRNNLVHNSTNYSKDDDIMAEFYIPS